jgi:SAM-dependent methyltransferase
MPPQTRPRPAISRLVAACPTDCRDYDAGRMTTMKARVADLLPRCVKDAILNGLLRATVSWRLIRRRRSEFVSGYLTGMRGIEIGASSHNRFYLDAINVDRFGEDDTVYKREERRLVLHAVKVDVVAPGDELPFANDSYDFVFSSHVIEHFPDPIKALYEWVRVARRYVVVIAPHRDRTFDIDNPLTPAAELVERHRGGITSDVDRHWSVWTCESFIELCNTIGLHVTDRQDPDDKVGNGFTVVIDAAASQSPNRINRHTTTTTPPPAPQARIG